MLDIYIPTFGRGHKLVSYVEHIKEMTPGERIVLILEAEDTLSIEEAKKTDATVVINHRVHTYAGSINSAWEAMDSDLFFAGADDLRFTPGWYETALSKMKNNIMVVGTNDLHNQETIRGEHATHYLVRGHYIRNVGGTIDKSAPVLPEVYDHNWTDREAILTAQKRGVFAPCLESIVEHLHFVFGLAPMDPTYEKSRVHVNEDQRIFEQRRSILGF